MDVNTAVLDNVEVFAYQTLANTDPETCQDMKLLSPTSSDIAIIM